MVEEKSSIVGSLTGGSSKPLAGISVRLLDSFFLDQVASTVTDKDGKFLLSNIPPGLYLMSLQSSSMPAMLRRVQVVSGAPTLVDIRTVLNAEEIENHNAWDKFKWTIRVAERNPLRDAESITPTITDYTPEGFLASLRNFQEDNNIEGEVSYVSVDTGATDSGLNHQVTQFAVQGGSDGENSWSFNGNIMDGVRSSYIASGNIQHRLFDHRLDASVSANDLLLARFPEVPEQRISQFVRNVDPQQIMSDKMWVTSVDLKDEWQFLRQLRIDYGTRVDYYGYLNDPVRYSPRLETSYHLEPELAVRCLYYHNNSAPGNYYLQPDDIYPYVHDIAFVPYAGSITPEVTNGYEIGGDFNRDGLVVSVFYHSEKVEDKIATVDLSNSPVNDQLQSIRSFVIFNAQDLKSHGVAFQVSKQLSPMFTAFVGYDLKKGVPVNIVEKHYFTQRQLFFVGAEQEETFHDIQAGVHADIPQTLTKVNAGWNYSSGTQLVYGRKTESLSSIDLEVHQGLPVRVFSQAQLNLLLAVKNLLDQNSGFTGNADFQRALVFGMPRTIAGGVLVKF